MCSGDSIDELPIVIGSKLWDHQVQDALTELINLLIQTPESVRQVEALVSEAVRGKTRRLGSD
jgi:hypothetical protein